MASVYLIQGLVKLYNGLVLFKIRLCVLHAVGCQVGFMCVSVRFRSGDQSSSVGGWTRESAPSSHLLSWRKEAAAAWTSLAVVSPPWPPREPGILLCHYRFRSPAPLGQRKQDEVVRCRPEVRVNRRSYPPTGLLFVESLSLPAASERSGTRCVSSPGWLFVQQSVARVSMSTSVSPRWLDRPWSQWSRNRPKTVRE